MIQGFTFDEFKCCGIRLRAICEKETLTYGVHGNLKNRDAIARRVARECAKLVKEKGWK
jgi:hypothetical protein